jgi:outer membrane lipoprotein LolB
LLWQVSGTEIPLAALFEWLNQRPAIAPGWVTDTNGMTQGQLLLRRTDPLPAVQLHIRLEQ